MHNDELREGSREISIWHTKSLTGSNIVEKQRIERERGVRVVGYAYTCVPLVINVPTTVRHMRAHENRGELARMAKSYFQRGTRASYELNGRDRFRWTAIFLSLSILGKYVEKKLLH